MAVNWALGLQQGPNAGDRFASAFQQGMADNTERAKKAAMAALVQDPNNPRALAALAKLDPSTAMDFRKTQLQYGQKTHDEWAKTVGAAAKMAKTPEQWDSIVDQFVANGHPEAAQLKGKFSPALRAAYMAQGGISDDAETQDPGIIREYTVAKERGLIDPNTTYTQYVTLRNPGSQTPVILPHNITQVGGGAPAGGGAPITATGPNGEKIQFNPQTNQWEPMGGSGGNAGGGFPGPH